MARKDPGLAAVISILAPGLGQVYNEQWLKAVMIFILFVIAFLTAPLGIGVLLLPVVYLLAIWDAYRSAK